MAFTAGTMKKKLTFAEIIFLSLNVSSKTPHGF
jgi:hypothetical protein